MKTAKRSVNRQSLEQKLKDQSFLCALTGEKLQPALSSLDHINPKCIGGDDEIGNVQVVLPCVNRAKGTMTQEQFVGMCHAVARTVTDTGDRSWVEWTGYKGVADE